MTDYELSVACIPCGYCYTCQAITFWDYAQTVDMDKWVCQSCRKVVDYEFRECHP